MRTLRPDAGAEGCHLQTSWPAIGAATLGGVPVAAFERDRKGGRSGESSQREEVGVYSRILVPLDGSKRAETILPHVEEMARRCEAKVILLQVIEPVPLVVGPEGARMALQQQQLEQLTEQSETYLAALRGEFRGKGINATARVSYGPVVEAIINAAESEGADLIAIASHGRGGLSQVFYGSVAAGVLQRVDRPLLIIRSLSRK